MSPRAAWRLEEHHGFRQVFDYVPGKMDWLSFGLSRQGWGLLAGDVIRRDVPACSLRDRVGEVRRKAADLGLCVAVNDRGIVMGLVREKTLEGADDEALVDQVMQFGVSTIRPSEPLEAVTDRMKQSDVDAVLVTSSDGRLMGLLVRADAERALEKAGLSSSRPG